MNESHAEVQGLELGISNAEDNLANTLIGSLNAINDNGFRLEKEIAARIRLVIANSGRMRSPAQSRTQDTVTHEPSREHNSR